MTRQAQLVEDDDVGVLPRFSLILFPPSAFHSIHGSSVSTGFVLAVVNAVRWVRARHPIICSVSEVRRHTIRTYWTGKRKCGVFGFGIVLLSAYPVRGGERGRSTENRRGRVEWRDVLDGIVEAVLYCTILYTGIQYHTTDLFSESVEGSRKKGGFRAERNRKKRSTAITPPHTTATRGVSVVFLAAVENRTHRKPRPPFRRRRGNVWSYHTGTPPALASHSYIITAF